MTNQQQTQNPDDRSLSSSGESDSDAENASTGDIPKSEVYDINTISEVVDKTPSFIPIEDRYAVVKVRHADKRYGRKGALILNNFNMTVKQGLIYSLLGSSGCGKTTALNCILGIRRLQKGEVLVFGKRPGSRKSLVPGRAVGYMPQEISLFGGFSIRETLFFYGTLFGMSNSEIEARTYFLLSFLRLSEFEKQRMGTLSLGQQRRVSLAIALIHSPELIILDEPTVGVDPLLREKIWEYLVDIVQDNHTTVIITTHYIEECRKSQMIGIMRSGRLLAEKDPHALLEEYHASYLEEVVLKLCHEDVSGSDELDNRSARGSFIGKVNPRKNNNVVESAVKGEDIPCAHSMLENPDKLGKKKPSEFRKRLVRLRAFTLKNILVMWRNMLLVLFVVLMPSFLTLLTCNGLGNYPKPIKFGVVNHEANQSSCLQHELLTQHRNKSGANCDLDFLSCKYVKLLPHDVFQLQYYDSEGSAIKAVQKGKSWGYIAFEKSFSENFFAKMSLGINMDINTLNGSFIFYKLDVTSRQHAGYIRMTLADTYESFLKNLLVNCGFNPMFGDRPILGLPPIYGSDDTNFREFVAPSLLVALLFLFPLCSSSIQFLNDRKIGTLERARVAGAHTSEIVMSYLITEGTILLIQTALALSVVIFVFHCEVKGSFTLLVLIYLIMGLGGVSAGFLVAAVANQEFEAIILISAVFFPNFLLSGLIWPVEGMSYVMQYAVCVLPATFPAQAIRSIMSRGWGFTHPQVWPGVVSPIFWMFVYWAATVLVLKMKHK